MRNEYKNAMEHFGLSPEADRRIEALLSGGTETEVIPLKKHQPKQLRWLIAAVLIVCLLAGTAVAAAVTRTEIRLIDLSWLRGEPHLEIMMPPLDDEYIEFYYHYPQTLPEGFAESFVSQRLSNRQSLRFENEAGDFLYLSYGAASEATAHSVGYAFEKEELQIGGSSAYRIVRTEPAADYPVHEILVWVDAEKGMDFFLEYGGHEALDLAAIAREVKPLDESKAPKPSYAGETDAALAFLGDYELGALPTGYELTEYSGMGGSEAEPWGAYVRATWRNEAHEGIFFEYSYFNPGATEGLDPAQAENPIELLVGERREDRYSYTDTAVNGLPACLSESIEGNDKHIQWIDLTHNLAFHLSAEALTTDELLALAESVTLSE